MFNFHPVVTFYPPPPPIMKNRSTYWCAGADGVINCLCDGDDGGVGHL